MPIFDNDQIDDLIYLEIWVQSPRIPWVNLQQGHQDRGSPIRREAQPFYKNKQSK